MEPRRVRDVAAHLLQMPQSRRTQVLLKPRADRLAHALDVVQPAHLPAHLDVLWHSGDALRGAPIGHQAKAAFVLARLGLWA
jgi:hypothetical protein